MTRVAFPLPAGRVGSGSYNYLLNLVRAIDTHCPDRITPVLFVGLDVPDREVTPFRDVSIVEVVRTGTFDGARNRARLMKALLWGRDYEAAREFREHRVDVAFEPAMFYGWRFPIPVIAWLPDFQHRHLPELFRARAYWQRELGFRAQTMSGRVIMLSSEDARRDCERFYSSSVGSTTVVRFAVLIDPAQMGLDPWAVAREYGLPEHFFYLPNQFWKHKNHRVVIDALTELSRQGYDFVVAASGKPDDARHPGHYAALQELVKSRGLERQFRFLGVVPREHVIALMRACTSLINPSLFEGWSTPVEEAKTLGVPMLLADLPVYQEQVGSSARFFDPHSPAQLAGLMASQPDVPRAERGAAEVRSIGASAARVRQFCLDFCATVERAADPTRRSETVSGAHVR